MLSIGCCFIVFYYSCLFSVALWVWYCLFEWAHWEWFDNLLFGGLTFSDVALWVGGSRFDCVVVYFVCVGLDDLLTACCLVIWGLFSWCWCCCFFVCFRLWFIVFIVLFAGFVTCLFAC